MLVMTQLAAVTMLLLRVMGVMIFVVAAALQSRRVVVVVDLMSQISSFSEKLKVA